MNRATHITIGAAVVAPIALTLSPGLALGVVWCGIVGGGFPDWLDLRSDFHLRMQHRGLSHSFICTLVITALFGVSLRLVATTFDLRWLSEGTITRFTLAFALGYLSHILADACTKAGVMPFAPFTQRRLWLLPRPLRGKSSGHIDFVARFIATAMIIVMVIEYWRILPVAW